MPDTPDGWVSLRSYVERILDEKDSSHQRALDLATESMSHRLDAMNQFRKQLEDERHKYIRLEQFQMIQDRVRSLEERDASRSGRQAVVLTMTTVVAGLLATVVTLLLRHMLP